MKDFLQFVVGQLVDRPDECILRVNEQGEHKQFVLALPRSEVGKVIGKQGHTIQAIRNLLSTAALRGEKRAFLEISERPE